MNLLIATNNLHKLREFKDIIKRGHTLFSFDDIGIQSKPQETGKSFLENATIKLEHARKSFEYFTSKKWKHPHRNLVIDAILAEDSGFCVEVLNGMPGIFSSRLGKEKYNHSAISDQFASLAQYQCSQILTKLREVQNRTAWYTCCIIVLMRTGELIAMQHHWHGSVVEEKPRGNKGFGYDPIFWVSEYSQTAAELSPQVKNRISHRALCANRIFSLL